MYTATAPQDQVANAWERQSLDSRLAALAAGRPRVAYFYENADTSTFRYRIYNMIQALEGTGVGASWFHIPDEAAWDRVVDGCDVVVVCRMRYTHTLNRMVTRARSLGRRVLFDSDDLVFDPAYIHMIVDTLDRPKTIAMWDEWFAYIGRISATMRLCEGHITTNPGLSAHAEAFSGVAGRVVPNFLNREQVALSAALTAAKRASGMARDGRLHVGYFSGTPTHNRDFALAAGAVARLMDRHAEVWLRVVGFLDIGPELARHRGRIEVAPLQDFLELQRLIAATEINIVPLQDNAFTNCKSELKYFDAAVVGALTLAAPTAPFRDAIVPGETGWLVPAHGWDDALEDAVQGFAGHGGVIDAAYDAAMERYRWDGYAARVRAAVFGP